MTSRNKAKSEELKSVQSVVASMVSGPPPTVQVERHFGTTISKAAASRNAGTLPAFIPPDEAEARSSFSEGRHKVQTSTYLRHQSKIVPNGNGKRTPTVLGPFSNAKPSALSQENSAQKSTSARSSISHVLRPQNMQQKEIDLQNSFLQALDSNLALAERNKAVPNFSSRTELHESLWELSEQLARLEKKFGYPRLEQRIGSTSSQITRRASSVTRPTNPRTDCSRQSTGYNRAENLIKLGSGRSIEKSRSSDNIEGAAGYCPSLYQESASGDGYCPALYQEGEGNSESVNTERTEILKRLEDELKKWKEEDYVDRSPKNGQKSKKDQKKKSPKKVANPMPFNVENIENRQSRKSSLSDGGHSW